MKWDHYQQAVLDEVASGQGHLVVNARAGSGKSTTIVGSLSCIPQYRDALFVAFNKRIADHLRNQVPDSVKVRTLHSLGFATLKDRRGAVTLDRDKGKRIARQVLAQHRSTLLKTMKVKANGQDPLIDAAWQLIKLTSLVKNCHPRTIKEIERLAIDFGIEDDRLPANRIAPLAAECCKRATAEADTVDFDDMIYLPAKLGLPPYPSSFVFVDETQDLNAAQLWLARHACANDHGRIIAIGDPKQAIYFWRGADREAMPRIVRELKAKELPLSVTYRCAQSIVDYIKNTIDGLDDLQARPGAPEGEVDHRDWEHTIGPFGARQGDFILSRLNAPLMPLCMHYLRHGIPAVVAGKDIGRSLIQLARRTGADSTIDMIRWLKEYLFSEHQRLKAEDALERFEQIKDQTDALEALAENCHSVDAVCANIEEMFSDDIETGAIVLSTVHKAKGLERDRVFLLTTTFRPGRSEEEDNIMYVACSRSKTSLFLVGAPPDKNV